MLRVNTKPRKRNSPRIAEKSAPAFLQWLRGRECILAFGCEGKIETAHVDYAGDKGMGSKVSDRYAVPMCCKHHRAQHIMGWRTFENAHNFSALLAAEQFWRAWPGRIAWERKLSDG